MRGPATRFQRQPFAPFQTSLGLNDPVRTCRGRSTLARAFESWIGRLKALLNIRAIDTKSATIFGICVIFESRNINGLSHIRGWADQAASPIRASKALWSPVTGTPWTRPGCEETVFRFGAIILKQSKPSLTTSNLGARQH